MSALLVSLYVRKLGQKSEMATRDKEEKKAREYGSKQLREVQQNLTQTDRSREGAKQRSKGQRVGE